MGEGCGKCGGRGYLIDGKGEFARALVCDCAGDCADCGGRGFFIEKKDGYKSKVPCGSCSVLRDNVKKYNRAQIPAVMAEAKVSVGEGAKPKVQKAVDYIEGFINHYPKKDGFVLFSSTGRGKIELAAAMVAELTLKQGVRCLFQDFGDLILRLKSRSEGTSELAVLEPLFKIPLLVIDSFGSGRDITDWEKNVLESIVSKRHGARAKTVVTTKYGGESELETHVGDRSFSRIKVMCKFLWMD